MIFADNAATTRLLPEAFEAMKPYLLEEYGNASQPYFFSKAAKMALKEARETVASSVGALPEEIYFTSGGTESDNQAIKASLFFDKNKNGIVASEIEHRAVLNSCATVRALGVPTELLPVDAEGVVRPSVLKDRISSKTGLASIMFGNNEIGTIEPIKELAEIAHDRGALFHTDAVQAVGHVPIDAHELDVDLLSASAHKFNGPKGVGFLYVKKGIKLRPFMDGGAQERGARAGTENVAAIVGMAVALKMNVARLAETQARLRDLEETLLRVLRESGLDFIRNGSENRLPGVVSVSFRDADGEMLLHRLDLKGVCVSTGSACDSVNSRVSHVIQAIKVPEEYASGTVRITFGAENTRSDAVEIASAVKSILRR